MLTHFGRLGCLTRRGAVHNLSTCLRSHPCAAGQQLGLAQSRTWFGCISSCGRLRISDKLKTPTSRRTVTIGRRLSELIAEHIGRFPNQHGLVFTGPEGGLLRRANFAKRVVKPAAARIGRPDLSMHDLRHTHASLLLASGEPITVVSTRLGTSTLQQRCGRMRMRLLVRNGGLRILWMRCLIRFQRP